MNKGTLYLLIGCWMGTLVFGLDQDYWTVSVLAGIVASGLGLLVAGANPHRVSLPQNRIRTLAIVMVVVGIGMLCYALLDRFYVGWHPGIQLTLAAVPIRADVPVVKPEWS